MTEAEIIEKVRRYVGDHYNHDWELAFYAYDGDHDGKITNDQVRDFLNDAGVGPHWMTSLISNRILAAADKNYDKRLTLAELKAAIEKGE